MNFSSSLFNDRLLITRKLRDWAKRGRAAAALVQTDADALTAEYGEEEAICAAASRALPPDGGWPRGHWDKVERELSRRTAVQRGGKTPR
jgi:uncharacterized protein with PIN domain